MNWFIRLYRHPTPAEIVQHQYEDAQRKLLEHASLAEFHNAMSKMLAQRVDRLRHGADWAVYGPKP